MSNYRLMRYRQRFWAIMDCDAKGRPITMTPVFFDVRLSEVNKALSKLQEPEEVVSEGDKKPKKKEKPNESR